MTDEKYYDEMTFEELYRDVPFWTVVEEGELHGIPYRIVRSMVSLTAYVGVSKDSPLVGVDYNLIPLDVHYGLTYSGFHRDDDERYWFGWDYAHSGDRMWCTDEMLETATTPEQIAIAREWADEWMKRFAHKHGWTIPEVRTEVYEAIEGFRKVVFWSMVLGKLMPYALRLLRWSESAWWTIKWRSRRVYQTVVRKLQSIPGLQIHRD